MFDLASLQQSDSELLSEVSNGLDSALEGLNNNAFNALDRLLTILHSAWNSAPTSVWRHIADHICITHPITSLLRLDPITNHSYMRPRGYAGDATLLDMIYGIEPHSWRLSCERNHLAQSVHKFTYSSRCGQSVRARRQILADLIDRTAARVSRPEIFSIAAGHARELLISQAFRHRHLLRFVALDQDLESIEMISRKHSARVECIVSSMKSLIVRGGDYGKFDLIYATGLLDYLSEAAARALAMKAFAMLKPGGQLVLANFKPALRDCVYLDTFMRWNLIYRTEEDLRTLGEFVVNTHAGKIELFSDSIGYVIYLSVIRE